MFDGDSEQLGVMESPKPKLMRILNLHYFMTFFFLPCVGQWGTKNRIAQNHLKCIAGERSLVIDNFLLSLQCGNTGVWGTKSEVSHNLILLVIYPPPPPNNPPYPPQNLLSEKDSNTILSQLYWLFIYALKYIFP